VIHTQLQHEGRDGTGHSILAVLVVMAVFAGVYRRWRDRQKAEHG